MPEHALIEAAKGGEREQLERLLSDGADVHEQDEQGWTALNWAAGRGDVESVRLLLDNGADVTVTGRDGRTPLMIAKAADRSEVGELLTEQEKKLGVWEDPRHTRPYCCAFYLRDLRQYDGWQEPEAAAEGEEGEEALTDDSIVYVHQDFTVTRSMWHGEDVLLAEPDKAWQAFCEEELGFAIPEDLL